MKTFDVEVVQVMRVTVDETKFTPEFFSAFAETMFEFGSLEEHVEHLAQLGARGLIDPFIEGYGPAEDMGIQVEPVVLSVGEPEALP